VLSFPYIQEFILLPSLMRPHAYFKTEEHTFLSYNLKPLSNKPPSEFLISKDSVSTSYKSH